MESSNYSLYVLIPIIISVLNQYFIYGIIFQHKTKFILQYIIKSLILTILLTFFLMKYFDLYGVIVANILGGIYYTYLLYKYSQGVFLLKHNTKMNLKIIIMTIMSIPIIINSIPFGLLFLVIFFKMNNSVISLINEVKSLKE